jgi:O-antigen/teichoic acid export membrane protein
MQRVLYMPVGIGAIIAVLANVMFTVRYGLMGATIAYLAAQIAFSFLTWHAFRRSVAATYQSLPAS